jgi:hypothetical protein
VSFRRVIYWVEAGVQTLPLAANRWLHGIAASLLAVALACCAFLKPDPSGNGTHRQLGLPACLVCRVTGINRCPSCGLTTAFAHAMRGDLRAAQRCNGAAPVAFIIAWAGLIYSAAIALTGRQWLLYELLAILGLTVATLIWWMQCFFSY